MINECIIIGGGHSINDGLALGLKKKIKNKFIIGCNYSFRHFDTTLICFYDRKFYHPKPEEIKNNPMIYDELKTLPLLAGINFNGMEEFQLPNTLLFKKATVRNQNPLKQGFYCGKGIGLTGIFALDLASFLLDYKGVIYLLGFDWTTNKKQPTHYYTKQEINHRGVGWVASYQIQKPNKQFMFFKKESNLKIYNVSLNSNINEFEKIDYTTFFSKLDNVVYNQTKLRTIIKEKLCISEKK